MQRSVHSRMDPSLLYLLSTTFGSGVTQHTPPTKPGTAQSGQVINEYSEVPSSSASLTRCPRGPSCTTPPRCSRTAPLGSPVRPIHPSVRPSVPPHPHGQRCTRQHPSPRGSLSTGGAGPGAGGTPGAGPSRPKKQSQRHGEGEEQVMGWKGRDGMRKLGQKGWEDWDGKDGTEGMGWECKRRDGMEGMGRLGRKGWIGTEGRRKMRRGRPGGSSTRYHRRRLGAYLRQVPDLQVEADDEGVPADPQHQPHRVLPAQSEAVRARCCMAPRAPPAPSRCPAPPR